MQKKLVCFLLIFCLFVIEINSEDETTEKPKGFIGNLFEKLKTSVDDTYTVSNIILN